MDLGNLADWVSAVGGLLAVIAAIVAWRVSQRLLEIEQERDRKRAKEIAVKQEEAIRKQAELIHVVGIHLPENKKWGVALHNYSQAPVFDVRVKSQRADGVTELQDLKIGMLPPGRFIVLNKLANPSQSQSQSQSQWDFMRERSQADGVVAYVVRGKGNGMVKSVSFRDANRRDWKRENNGNGIMDLKSVENNR